MSMSPCSMVLLLNLDEVKTLWVLFPLFYTLSILYHLYFSCMLRLVVWYFEVVFHVGSPVGHILTLLLFFAHFRCSFFFFFIFCWQRRGPIDLRDYPPQWFVSVMIVYYTLHKTGLLLIRRQGEPRNLASCYPVPFETRQDKTRQRTTNSWKFDHIEGHAPVQTIIWCFKDIPLKCKI